MTIRSSSRRTCVGRHVLAPALATALLALAGCAFVELAWRQAEGTILDRVDTWLDLDPAQEDRLTARLRPWLQHTRRTRLPEIATFLERVAAHTERGFDADDMAWASGRFWTLYGETIDGMIGWLVPTLVELEPAQRRHLVQRMVESNADYRAEYVDLDPAARRDALAERIIEQVERWTGPLDRRQRALVHEHAARFPDTAPDWYRYRLRMQAGLLARLERGAAPDVVRRHLRAWWIEFEPRRPAERATTRELRADIGRTLVALAATLDASQRARAVRRLRDLSADLAELAATMAAPG